MRPDPLSSSVTLRGATDGIHVEDLPGGLTAVPGVRAVGLHCGIRRKHPDLALVATDAGSAAAGVFTRNRLAAAPVILCREHLSLSGGRAGAVVVNSGNANACTGAPGMEAARRTAATTARLLDLAPEQVLVSSTGVIGVPLPVDKILTALPRAAAELDPAGGAAAARAILTTDTRPKETAVEVRYEAWSFRIGGMAKGSGMIHPDMATTLGFLATDAPVSPALLGAALRRGVDRTFNRISVDGDTSTNDCVLALANGRAGGPRFEEGSAGYRAFAAALEEVLKRLALMVVADGEGASRTLEVRVSGAADEAEAVRAAKAVCLSPLVKTALHGADPNWGRVASSIGACGVDLAPDRLSILLEGLEILGPGFSSSFEEEEAVRRLSQDRVLLEVDLGVGEGQATAWTCDLSADYIRINADYRT